MSERIFDGRIAGEIAPDDHARQERLKAIARALVTAVRDGLVRDGAVRLHGFGTFRLRPVAARRGRNPRTGEAIDIPAGWRVMFRPAKALRERVEPDSVSSLPIGEPHASREAMLAASSAAAGSSTRRGAGGIPAEGIAGVPSVEPERAAAAAMPEPKFSVQGPVPPGAADLEADSSVTRSSAALTRAPVANESAPTQSEAAQTPVTESSGAASPVTPDTARRSTRYRYALALLLVVLLVGLAWLFQPGDSPLPRVAENGGQSAPREAAGDPASATPDQATTSAGGSSEKPAIASAGIGSSDSRTGTDSTSARTGAEEQASAATDTTEAPTTTAADPDVSAASDDTAAEATTAAPAQTPSAPDTGGGTAAQSSSAAAGDSGDDIPLGGAGSAQTGHEVTEPVADTPGRSEVAEPSVAAERVTGEAGSGGNPWFSGRDYTVRSGDTLWDLADQNYINPYYWPHIWNHNADIANPDRLDVREGLWLPALQGDPRSLTETDRRSIAEGYLRLYRFFRAEGDANPQYALVGVRYFDPSVLPDRLRDTAAGHPGDTLAAVFLARLEAEFPLD